jgi:predicted helicase
MIIQHILTEDLFKSVFDESDFHHENNIASQLENLVNTFMSRSMRQNQLGELGHYYKTLNAQAALVSDHHEKQKFLKVVYENFYKVYNPKGADKLGVVYTPNEIVRFMVQSTDYLLQKHFNKGMADKNVHILDPATGTGTFITDIIDYIPSQYLEHKYKHEIFANEVAILPYYVANLNIEYTYKQKMGKYLEFPNSCFVDTLDNIDGLAYDGKQHNMFGFSSENAERIKRQNEQKISVIIGNPPYNANQANFNDFNKNREYPDVDKRIKETYVKFSTAQKSKVYDMYARFYRWATDRIDKNGILAFVTNRSFIDSRTFDGFRKIISSEFNHIYSIDLGGDVRSNPKLSGPKHNIFGIQTGVAIMILVKDNNEFIAKNEQEFEEIKKEHHMVEEPKAIYGERTAYGSKCRIYYYRRPEEELAIDKLQFLNDAKIQDLAFDVIHPQYTHNHHHGLLLARDRNMDILYLPFSLRSFNNAVKINIAQFHNVYADRYNILQLALP